MSQKKVPPPPSMPPSIKIKENFCLLHKGDLTGQTYECPSCKTKYCLECAKKARAEKKSCVKCKKLFML